MTLENDGGHITWQTGALPQKRVAGAWYAFAGSQGEAELVVDQKPLLRFPLGSSRDFEVEAGDSRLCYRALPERSGAAYGRYVLLTGGSGKPLALTVRYSSGMSTEPLFHTLDLKAEGGSDSCVAASAVPSVNGAARILDGSANTYPQDTGRFRVAEVY